MPVEITLVTMTRYESTIPATVCYEPGSLKNVLGEYLASKGLAQFRCAETEKYAHVTYFSMADVNSLLMAKNESCCPHLKLPHTTCSRR